MLRCIHPLLKWHLLGSWLYLVLNEAVMLRTNWFLLKTAPNVDFSALWELHEAWLLLSHPHRFVRLLFSLLAPLFLPLQTLQVLVFTFERMGHWVSDHQHRMWIPTPVSPATMSLWCLPVPMLHCPGKSWERWDVVEGVKKGVLLLVKAKNSRMQFQKRSEAWDHPFECNHIIEKFTLASQEGKGKTGEVKHGGNKFCV